MFENIVKFFKKANKREALNPSSKETAKERLHLVLMQDRANVSADFLDLMRQEIIEVIKKYIDIDETAMDVRLTNQENADGTQGAPALYANIPILNIKDESRKLNKEEVKKDKNEEKSNKEEKEPKEEKDRKEKNKLDNSKSESIRVDGNKGENNKKENKDKKEIEKNKQESKKLEEAKKIVKEKVEHNKENKNNKENNAEEKNKSVASAKK